MNYSTAARGVAPGGSWEGIDLGRPSLAHDETGESKPPLLSSGGFEADQLPGLPDPAPLLRLTHPLLVLDSEDIDLCHLTEPHGGHLLPLVMVVVSQGRRSPTPAAGEGEADRWDGPEPGLLSR